MSFQDCLECALNNILKFLLVEKNQALSFNFKKPEIKKLKKRLASQKNSAKSFKKLSNNRIKGFKIKEF